MSDRDDISAEGPQVRDEAFWVDFLTRGAPRERAQRRLFSRLPHGPRCRICAAPFGGAGGSLMRVVGKGKSAQSPELCNSCFTFMSKNRGGAEITCTLLFADIRGSTSLAETMSPLEFHGLLNRFYEAATNVVFTHDGTVDKFVGDEVVATFFPLLAGDRHAERGVAAGRALLAATGHGDPGGPWVPVGVGVHTGRAWMGAVGEHPHVELTAVGDTVNIAARLASVAQAGEVLVTVDAARAAGLDPSLEVRSLELKGKQLPTEVVTLRLAPA
jgi:adenylate cyclase